MAFSELTLIPPLLRAVEEAGYRQPSPIQQKAIPPVLAGRDLLGCAQTGTGKTAAFALPILQLLAARGTPGGARPIRALVLTPTRELALQIEESFETYGKHMKMRSTVIFGGVGQAPQVAALKRGVDILVATPGRLNDLIGQGYIKLGQLEIFVLDEADRMLDMGFVNDVKKVIRQLPEKRQTLLFSATMPKEIVELANGLLHSPKKVFVTPPATTVEKIEQHLYKVDKTNKRHLLAKLLEDAAVESALVFTRTKHGADRVVRELKKAGVVALAIHGNKSQGARQTALSAFKTGKVGVLVATDIAARGLDINELTHVFNYDLPNIPETYVHRIGRTGRAGRAGVAVSFCSADELPYLADIEKLIGFTIPEEKNPGWPMEILEASAVPAAPKPAHGQKTAQPRQRQEKPKPERPAKDAKKPGPKRPAQRAGPAIPLAKPAQKPAPKAPPQSPQRQDGPRQTPANPYENRTGGAAIITKRPVWSNLPPAPLPGSNKGEDDMSRNNRRRHGQKRHGGPEAPARTAAAAPKKEQPPAIKKNEKGVFDFSEEELSQDHSLRLISGKGPDEIKYASFEEYLKDH